MCNALVAPNYGLFSDLVYTVFVLVFPLEARHSLFLYFRWMEGGAAKAYA